VEQPAGGRLEGVGPPAEVDGDSTAEMEGDHEVGLKVECRPSGTWVEHPPSRLKQRPFLPLLLHKAQQASSYCIEALTSSVRVHP
jgi:hypothetical protein